MLPVYYTRMPIVDLAELHLGVSFHLEQDLHIKHRIQVQLYEQVKKVIGDGKFYLVPSLEQSQIDAYEEAKLYHPENFPMDSDESIGFGSSREDS